MRTLVIDAPVELVRRTWVQSPDLDRMECGELLRLARAAGLVVELLEDQGPLSEASMRE